MNTPRAFAMALLLATLGPGLTGCLSTDKRFVPVQADAGRVVLYVYRENGIVGRGLDLQVLVNGENVAQLAVGTYHTAQVEPGALEFQVRAVRASGPLLTGVRDDAVRDNTLLLLDVEPDGVYYVKVEEGLGYVLMEPVAAAEAGAALAKLRLVPAGGS